jgi:hypothetical protein
MFCLGVKGGQSYFAGERSNFPGVNFLLRSSEATRITEQTIEECLTEVATFDSPTAWWD